jgi:phospholipase C
LDVIKQDQQKYTRENFQKLSPFEKSIHAKAFTTNKKDASYHKLTSLNYNDGSAKRELKVPAGDVLFQFREDVKEGTLPTVSWLVAPENFSDHPGAPWYGAWYISEVLDILTKNPEIWKKTIFILAYDENDGYLITSLLLQFRIQTNLILDLYRKELMRQ